MTDINVLFCRSLLKQVHTEVKQKYPSINLVKDSYWWWKFRYGEKQVSKTMPRASQLTQSGFLSTVYAIEESLADVNADREEIRCAIENATDELNRLRDETDDKFNNMPDSLQQGDTGQLLEGRVSELESFDVDAEESLEALKDDLCEISYSGD